MRPRPPAFRPDAPRIGRNPALRPNAQRADVETDAYAAFILRAVRAYGRRVGAGDVEDLAGLVALRDEVDRIVADAVAELRAEPQAHPWQRIADVLGITRQAAMKRWPHARGARRPGGQPAHLR